MNIDKTAAKRSRAHVRYRLSDGTLIPGVTTILGVLNKPALVGWANRMGLQGIDTTKYVDALAEIGTIAHEMILCHHRGEQFQPNGYSFDLIDRAENAMLSYFAWEKTRTVKPILCEAQLVSHKHRFGGMVDFYGEIDGVKTLVDYKTSKALWPEHAYQVTAYRHLLEENGHEVRAVRILRVGREESEGFEDKPLANLDREWEIFQHCLALYNLKAVGR